MEVDALVHLRDGRWGAVEIKMDSKEIDKAAEIFLKLRSLVVKQPVFLMVLTATDIAYRRPDGVLVVPVGCLKD
ncbi:MAG: hypothetical protein LBE09_06630 [Christensenellaceae bacterium]|nr:hypothetical protein [Christensenellaceae bacterium]